MYDFIINQHPFVFYALLIIIAIFVFFVSWKLSSFFTRYQSSKKIQNLINEKNIFQKESKKMWDSEKDEYLIENAKLKEEISNIQKRLDDYRKKLSGLGVFSFGESKKRADILYSLIMENELLEQILYDQSAKLTEQHKDNLDQRLLDIKKRQRLLAEIFDDKKIKDYVKEVIDDKDFVKDKNLLKINKTS